MQSSDSSDELVLLKMSVPSRTDCIIYQKIAEMDKNGINPLDLAKNLPLLDAAGTINSFPQFLLGLADAF